MRYSINPDIQAVSTPPIAQAQNWVRGREFPPDLPLLDISQAVPSYGPPDSLLSHLCQDLHREESALYTDILGLPALRRELAAHLSADYGGKIDAGQTAITAGCNQAFCLAIEAVARPGDDVVMVLPYYFNHQMWLQMRGIHSRLVTFSDREEDLLAGIEAQIGPVTRAIVLVTPNNPTGMEYSAGFMNQAFDLAASRSVALVVDETYKDFRSASGPPHRLLQRPDWDANLIQLLSFSKSYAMTGYRVGAMTANPELLEEVEKIVDNVTICPSHPGQLAALYGLRHLGDWRRQKAQVLKQRVARLRHCFQDQRLGYTLASSGAYFAYVRHPFGADDAFRVAKRLADEFAVLCLPGPVFGPGQEEYLRFAFANLSEDLIPELVRRLLLSEGIG